MFAQNAVRTLRLAVAPPRYYRYARRHIVCECPLCRCPYQNGREYSFVYVNEKRGLMYYDVPKCASTSIRTCLFDGNDDTSLMDPRKALDHYFKFTFVRNPWDRMVSNWKMFTTRPFRIGQLHSMTRENLSSFNDFVAFAAQHKNHHWQPQSLFLPDRPDFVGKLETFEQDFETLCRKIGIDADTIPHENPCRERHAYTTYYTDELMAVVAGMYADDISMFGYEFGG